MKTITLGILAHVDAGNTTLCEALLYSAGAISSLGRVDKGTAALDGHSIERERGITIFSKLALFDYKDTAVTLLDTPGHQDFLPEAQRSLAVEDYAILVISAKDGITPHTKTLYGMLSDRRIPTFVFVNKTDICDRRRIDLVDELRCNLDKRICDFILEDTDKERFFEECASYDESLMQFYFDTGKLSAPDIAAAIKRRNVIPCFFGSALRNIGVSALLNAIDKYSVEKSYGKALFGAKVYKIATDESGVRLSYMKITSGELRLKDTLVYKSRSDEPKEERVEQIRLYSADKFKQLKSAEAGMVVAVPNLEGSYAGLGLGACSDDYDALSPALDYRMIFDEGTDIYDAYLKLLPLGEEEPTLGLRYDAKERQIRVLLSGEIQTEVLKKLIEQRFGLRVNFGEASIHYKETITEKVYGAGHFEPLTHYAEVRLRLEPLPQGSGMVFDTNTPTDVLKTNWQRLILSHLEGRAHRGKLIGAPITDMKITLIAGRAHPKHTEGGDFRQATFRAVNQGLMKAKMRLLEPTFNFEATLPEASLGRFLYDVETMAGECEPPEFCDGEVKVRGFAPVYGMRSYQSTLRSYTHGEGKISFTAGDYYPCHNEEEIVKSVGYNPELDERANPNSVFCKGGAGYLVPWYEADEKMHTENPEEPHEPVEDGDSSPVIRTKTDYKGTVEEDRELMRIFEATYGKIKQRKLPERKENSAKAEKQPRRKAMPKGEEFLLIDGYNLIFASDELKRLAEGELGHARDTLIRLICNYKGVKNCKIIIVFDAYNTNTKDISCEEYGEVSVVYTKARQTADAYIERTTYKITEPDRVRVVTSDYKEQLIVLGNGALRVPAREFLNELKLASDEISSYTVQ